MISLIVYELAGVLVLVWMVAILRAVRADRLARRNITLVSGESDKVGKVVFPTEFAKTVTALHDKASYTPSAEAREKIEKNCDGCQRSGESKISFRGPLPVFVKPKDGSQ